MEPELNLDLMGAIFGIQSQEDWDDDLSNTHRARANQQAIDMEAGAFADWAVEQFGVDYDSVMFWDMLRDLSGKSRMSGDWEMDARSDGGIPAELYDLLMARKQGRVTVQSPNVPTPVRLSEWELRDGTAE